MIGGLIAIVEDRDAKRHSTPAPEPGCTCGIYAEKTDLAGEADIPRLAHLPQANGLVELSGVVIECVRGYRAQRAAILGPLELRVRCAGRLDILQPCPNPPVEVEYMNETPRGACHRHAGNTDIRVGITEWLDLVVPQLQATYETSVFTFQEG